MHPRLSLLAAIGATLFLGACCNCPPTRDKLTNGPLKPLPAPISMEEQVRLLNARAQAMPLITGIAPLGGVIVRYQDDDKKPHKESVDGRLWILQHFDNPGRSADVVLYGRVAGQEIIQAGKNDEKWWCILRANGKRAWIGDVPKPTGYRVGPAEDSAGGSILRADRILDVLALTPIAISPLVTMRHSDDDQANILMFWRPTGRESGMERQITIDRATGLVTDVRLFAPDATLLVHAFMDTYRPVEYTGGAKLAPGLDVPQMPHHLVIEYPAAPASIELKFDEVNVPAKVNPAVFNTPEWDNLDIKPEIVK